MSQNNEPSTISIVPIRYCLYARKSTESDEQQALSIDSQIKEMLELANKEKLEVTEIRRESHSAKASGTRPVYNQLLEDVRVGKFNGILTWAPDRLSRNAGDLGSIVDLMDQKLLLEIRTYGQRFTNNPSEKFLLMILCSQAKLENDNKSVNVKRGLKAMVEKGLWPCVAPTGYLNEMRQDRKGELLVDPNRASFVKQMFEKVADDNWSGRKLYIWLKDEIKFTTKFGKPLTRGNIYLILRNSFYYGIFEYPKDSGRWYTGKHKPMIDRELFDKVQKKLTDNNTNISRNEIREFIFTKLMRCGLCGSGITGMEKFKKLKNGTTKTYIYYTCTRSKNVNCKGQYMQEAALMEQLLKLLDQVDLDELGLTERVKQEVARYNRFRSGVLGIKEADQQTDTNIRNYAKYMIKEGTIYEKREILEYMKNKLVITEKVLSLEK